MNTDTIQRPAHQMMPDGPPGPRAFPISADEFFDRGMLLRDYFAAAALTGLIASDSSGDYALRAYAIADDMLAVRQKKPVEG